MVLACARTLCLPGRSYSPTALLSMTVLSRNCNNVPGLVLGCNAFAACTHIACESAMLHGTCTEIGRASCRER